MHNDDAMLSNQPALCNVVLSVLLEFPLFFWLVTAFPRQQELQVPEATYTLLITESRSHSIVVVVSVSRGLGDQTSVM